MGLPARAGRARAGGLSRLRGARLARRGDCRRARRAGRRGPGDRAGRGPRRALAAAPAPPGAPGGRRGRRGGRARGPRRARRPGRDHLHVGRHRRPQGRAADAPQHPRERGPRRERGAPVPPLRPSVRPVAVPQPAAAQPHVRPGHGHLHPAAAGGDHGLHARLQPGRHRAPDPPAARVGRGVRAQDTGGAARPRPAPRPGSRPGASAAQRGPALVALPAHPPAVRLQVLGLRRRRRAARPRARGVLVAAGLSRRPGLRAHGDGAHRDPQPPVPHAAGHGRPADRGRRREARPGRRDPGAREQRDRRLLQRRGRDRRGLRRRLVPDRGHRRLGRGREPDGQGPQEGGDRHPRGAERVSAGRRAGAGRRARRAGVRRGRHRAGGPRARARGAGAGSRRRAVRGAAGGQPAPGGSPADPGGGRSGRTRPCRAPRARAS